ncbi:MAG: zinc ABC transporter substrate-binding protein [Herpetosiphonaceae bacterium]|nr:zinc ABC transporter substrate-binding protein [Herpetosiphonaceae bacterium]
MMAATDTATSGAMMAATSASTGKKIKVVTTVAPLTNIVRNVGGDRIDLHGIIPDGTDSHTFEPAPSDAQVLAAADLILVNGLHLESPTEKMANANKQPNVEMVRFGDNTITQNDWIFDFSFPKDKGDPNPHLWMNVQYAMHYAEVARDALIKTDPANKDYYTQNATTFLAKLKQLDDGIATSVQTIPAGQRKLVTYHDSWAYFARRYGMTVIGAIQPSDFAEPSPKDVASMVDQLKAEHVPALFGSEVFPSKVLDEIGKEAGVKYIDTLRDDDPPGKAGDPNHTYIGMILSDMQAMIPALGGNIDALKSLDPADSYAKN